MKITKSEYEGKRLYELVLSRRDFDDICSGCPDGGFIVGRHADIYFHIFDGNNISSAWQPMSEGYYLTVGVSSSIPPSNATAEEWDKSAQKFYDSLEEAINNSGRIPIEDELIIGGKPKKINLGYVVIKVEPL
jgi:hypothetical protein